MPDSGEKPQEKSLSEEMRPTLYLGNLPMSVARALAELGEEVGWTAEQTGVMPEGRTSQQAGHWLTVVRGRCPKGVAPARCLCLVDEEGSSDGEESLRLVCPFRAEDFCTILDQCRTTSARRGRGVLSGVWLDPVGRTLHTAARGRGSGAANFVSLTVREVRLVDYLLAGGEVSREQILADVWGYPDSVETQTLETHATKLRKKLRPLGLGLECHGGLFRLEVQAADE